MHVMHDGPDITAIRPCWIARSPTHALLRTWPYMQFLEWMAWKAMCKKNMTDCGLCMRHGVNLCLFPSGIAAQGGKTTLGAGQNWCCRSFCAWWSGRCSWVVLNAVAWDCILWKMGNGQTVRWGQFGTGLCRRQETQVQTYCIVGEILRNENFDILTFLNSFWPGLCGHSEAQQRSRSRRPAVHWERLQASGPENWSCVGMC